MRFYENPVPSLTNWESLHQALAADQRPPKMMSIDEYEELTPEQKQAFDDRRKAYVAGDMTVATPQVQDLISTSETVMEQNHHALAGRRGILLSGPSATGKTTACIALMRYTYLAYEHQFPDLIDGGAVPVAYVEVPPGSTAKAMMQRFADFYSIPYSERTSLNVLKHAVVNAMREGKTQLVILDEFQNLGRISGTNGHSIDTVKDLSNDSPATFIYSGIKLESSGLLAGSRGDQVARRFTPIRLELTRNNKLWQKIVEAFAGQLPLFANDPEGLVKLSAWLHKQTGGNLGTLQSILVQATHRLIAASDPEAETLTEEVMKQSRRDLRALAGGSWSTLHRSDEDAA